MIQDELIYKEKGLAAFYENEDANAENAMNDGIVSYIITFKELPDNENVVALLESHPGINKIELHRLDNISDEERTNKENYDSIMRSNLELIKKELYQQFFFYVLISTLLVVKLLLPLLLIIQF